MGPRAGPDREEFVAGVPIAIEGVRKLFADPYDGSTVEALNEVTLDIPDHSFVSLLGPSGCGKTTLLRMIAGIEAPTSGHIAYKGRTVDNINDDMGYVPQNQGLFPWMTLWQNVELPLRLRNVPTAERKSKVGQWIDKVGLSGFGERYPWQLSGGMEKRGSLARAWISEPDVILMDEPFGPLDAQTRLLLQDDLMRLWSERRNIIVFVTHDLVEAVTLSDFIVIFCKRPGRIKRVVEVPIARPRDAFAIFDADGFTETFDEVRDVLREEMAV